jgi:hypothetical protein
MSTSSANAPKEAPMSRSESARRACAFPRANPLKGLRVLLIGSVVLRHRPGHGLLPVLSAEAAHRVSLGKRRLPGHGACREHVVQFQVESLRNPGFLVIGHPGQTDRYPGRFGKGRPECLHPHTGVVHSACVHSACVRDEQAVTPMEVGIVWGADEQVIPAVLNGGARVLEDGEVGRPAGREVAHAATLPDHLRKVRPVAAAIRPRPCGKRASKDGHLRTLAADADVAYRLLAASWERTRR